MIKDYATKPDLVREVAKKFIANGFNRTKAMQEVRPYLTKGSAAETGSQVLKSIEGKKTLRELLENSKELNKEEIGKILARNARQSKQLNASNTALDIAIRVQDEYPKHQIQANHLHLHLSATEIDNKIKAIQDELALLSQS